MILGLRCLLGLHLYRVADFSIALHTVFSFGTKFLQSMYHPAGKTELLNFREYNISVHPIEDLGEIDMTNNQALSIAYLTFYEPV